MHVNRMCFYWPAKNGGKYRGITTQSLSTDATPPLNLSIGIGVGRRTRINVGLNTCAELKVSWESVCFRMGISQCEQILEFD